MNLDEVITLGVDSHVVSISSANHLEYAVNDADTGDERSGYCRSTPPSLSVRVIVIV